MKTIITLDKANKPFGYPQLDNQGRLQATGSFSGVFMNPQTITDTINIPANHNALFIGPVGFGSNVTVGSGSNLNIL